MEDSTLFRGKLSENILEEIALEGLNGISLEGLWIRLGIIFEYELPFQETFQRKIWTFIKNNSKYIKFYKESKPRELIHVYNRFKSQEDETKEHPFRVKKLYPIFTQEFRGSCEDFDKRIEININSINELTLAEIQEKYGDYFIMVAIQPLRESILFPTNAQRPSDITPILYCILEVIGRSRFSGEKTCGKNSLQTYCKDSSELFYLRNKLITQNLIKKQPYTEVSNGRTIYGFLLCLPKFFITLKTKSTIILETVFQTLKNRENCQIDLEKLKQILGPDMSKSFMKLQLTTFYRKYFELLKVKYRLEYPEATIDKWKRKGSEDEKLVTIMRLKDHNLNLEDMINSEHNSHNNNHNNNDNHDAVIEYLNDTNFLIDMPYKEQLYDTIAEHGHKGCSQPEMMKYLVTNRFIIRALVNKLLDEGLITQYWEDFGRQKTRMYVATEYSKISENIESEGLTVNDNIETLKCDDSKIMDETAERLATYKENPEDIPIDNLTNITATVADVSDLIAVKITIRQQQQTLRQIKRQKLIVNKVNERLLIDKTLIRKDIAETEYKDGYKDQICGKSLFRIFTWLAEKKIIKVYDITLKMRNFTRVYRYIAHPELNQDHRIIQEEIIKLKNQLHSTVEERELREKRGKNSITQEINNSNTSNISNNDKNDKSIIEENNIEILPIKPFYRRAPKFLTCRFFHEFIYYLIYEMNSNMKPIDNKDKIIKCLIESYPQYDLNELDNDLLTFYDDNLSWKMFIPPIIRHTDKPFGWAYILDTYARIPLSMLTKFFQIDKDVHPLLDEYLNHPIKQHYLLQELPNQLQELIYQFRVGKICLIFYKILSCIGLVQLGKRSFKDPKETWFYLNRNGLLLDTSISEPAYRFTSLNKNYIEHRYKFDTLQDIQNYWNFLYKTCCVTRLGVRIDVQQKNKQEQEEMQPVDFDIAPINDIGYIPGDKRGAGGLDSLLFAHLKMNWCLTVKAQMTKTKLEKHNLHNSTNTKTLIKLGTLKAMKMNADITTNPNKKRKNITTLVTGRSIPIDRKKRCLNKRQAVEVETENNDKRRGRNIDYDQRDREALMRMDSLRVQWNKDEDNLLKVCRAVFLYLSDSVAQLHRIISGHNYRDVLHWGLNARNKTSRACQRRILYILKQKPNADLTAWVHELTRNQHIKQRFGSQFLENLRKIYPSDLEFSEALQVHFVQLVYYLNRIIKNAALQLKNECILPDTLTQFYVFYQECPNPPDYNTKKLKHYDPTNEEDIEISTINSIMHSTMCCNKDKTLYNIQIFEIYKKYKEDTLSKAFKKSRKDNLVVCSRGDRKAGLMTGSTYTLSVKYRQALYLNIPYQMFDMFYEKFELMLTKFFANNSTETEIETENDQNHIVEYKTINPGGFFLLTELSSKNYINIEIDIPQKILTIDSSQQQNINNSDRILDHFRQIFDNAPKTEYSKIFEEANRLDDINEFSRSTTRVKFNIANENYKLTYNPYDVLFKLSEIHSHFFCALDHLNKIIDLDFTRFTANNFCPFNCILKNTNFINAVERIIHDRKLILEDLIRSNTNHIIIDNSIHHENIIILNQKNLMYVYKKLQHELRVRNEKINLKDFGKISTTLKTTPIDILGLCKDLIEYSDQDDYCYQKLEYEPSVNKEEKIVRAQDVFVVNLPTLKITYNNENNNEMIEYKNKRVPSELVMSDIKRDQILHKIISNAVWSHHGSVEKLLDDADFQLLSNETQSFTLNVLNYIATFPLGIIGQNLIVKFTNAVDLTNAIKILIKNYLIMRLGIENFTYVHKKHIAPWVVQTYRIKRLDTEALQGSVVRIETNDNHKRKLSDVENTTPTSSSTTTTHTTTNTPTNTPTNTTTATTNVENSNKFLKIDDSKRISKPVERYSEGDTNIPKTKVFIPREKEIIVLRPYPWIRMNGSLNRRVLDKWLGSILLDCITHCGQTVQQLCLNFNQMQPVDILFLLEILKELNCIKMNVMKRLPKINLFSKYEEIPEEEPATEFSDKNEVFIVALPNAVLNISVFIGEKKYSSDFL